MARPLRIQYPGAFYHVTSRGNERRAIFKGKEDREKFLSYLESATQRYGALIHAYCLMDNHYHLLLETPEANLSEILHHINSSYTTYFNKKRKRYGHLFQGRYKAVLVERDAYAQELSRYIHLNPARLGFEEKLKDILWTSFPAYVKTKKKPSWLKVSFILSYFGKKGAEEVKRYRAFVHEGLAKNLKNPLSEAIASTILGRKDFVTWVRRTFVKDKENRDQPALRELRSRPTIDQIKEEAEKIFGKESEENRRIALYLSHLYSGRPLSEIAKAFGDIGPSAVSQNTRRIKERQLKDKYLGKVIERVEKEIIK